MSSQDTLTLSTLEQAQEMGLRSEEFDRIIEILGRTPNFCELSIFGVMCKFYASGNFVKDMLFIEDKYKNIKGKNPEYYNPKIY